jgi:hypothetical protein
MFLVNAQRDSHIGRRSPTIVGMSRANAPLATSNVN